MSEESEEGKAAEGKTEEAKPATKAEKAEKSESAEKHDDDTIKWRAKYKVTKEELETIKAKTESEKLELTSKVETTFKERQMFEEKYINAEVKAHAVAAGIKDIEFVKLIDIKDVKLDDKGNIIGIDKAIADVKTRKPEWFGAEKKSSTSTNATFAEKETKTPMDARSMSKDDWKKNKSMYMAGHLPRT